MVTYLVPIKHVNCYLVQVNDFYIAIDAGWAGCINEYQKELRSSSIDLKRIKYLFVTHFHPDHAGLVENLKKLGVRFVLFQHQIPFIPIMEKMIRGDRTYVPIDVNSSLILNIDDASAFFVENNIPAQALKTVGHSEDSISLVFHDGSAYIGDLCLPDFIMDDDQKSTNSWNLLRQNGTKIIYPAHGAVFHIDS
jgi:glyoxylase-like metal-dependent hydrolase (beta-lactamase superfamily II)